MNITKQQSISLCTDPDQVLYLWGLGKTEDYQQLQSSEKLWKHMSHPLAARCVWERLATPEERLVLWHCVGKTARRGLTQKDLLTRTALTSEECTAATTSLIRQYLLVESSPLLPQGEAAEQHPSAKAKIGATYCVYTEQAEALYQTGRELFIRDARRTAMSLSKLLQSASEAELWHMIRHYALDPTGLRRESDLRAALTEALTDADLVQGALSALDTFTREVFSWLVEQGGQAGMQFVRRHFAIDNDELFALLERLAAHGLAFDTLCSDVPGLRLLFIPQALSESIKIRATASPARQHGLVSLAAFPATVEEGVPALVGDLAVVVNATYQQRVERTREGTVLKHCATRIQPLLRGRARPGIPAENLYLAMLFETAERLKLIQWVYPPFSLHSLKPYYEPGPGLAAWARLSLEEQTQHLLAWWTTNPNWRDVTGNDFQQWNPVAWEPLAARPLLLSALRQCAPGIWYGIDDLLLMLWQTYPYALHPAEAQRAQGLRPTEVLKAKWLRCEGVVLRGILTSTLWELGLVSLGRVKDTSKETYDAFQLTGLGAAVLQTVTSDSRASHSGSDALVLLPTGEALLLELDTVVLYRLLSYVEVRQVDRAIRLAFTRSSITRAIDHGHALQALLEFLEGEKYQIPQNVRYMLRDWAASFKVAELKHVLLLSVSGEEGARLLVAAPRLRAWGLRLLTPTLIAAPAHAHLGELRRALETEGIVVRLGNDLLPYPAPYIPQQSKEGAGTGATAAEIGSGIFPEGETL